MSSDPTPATQVHRIGLNIVELTGEVLIARFHGTLSLPEAQLFTAYVDARAAEHGPLYAVLDMSQATSPSQQAREWIGQWGKSAQLLGNAVFGAGTIMRLILTMMSNASRLLFGRSFPLVFCATEAEALAWVAAQRRQHATASAESPGR